MGVPSSVTVLIFKFTCIVVTFMGVSGASPDCQAFPVCSCKTIFNDKGVELGTSVDCSSKGLTTVPIPNTSFNPPIYELKLNNNSIVRLEENILSNINITKLDLSKNAISSVHNNAFGNLGSYLKILILSGNSLGEPPKAAFSPLQRLEELILSNYNVPHLNNTQSYFNPFKTLKYLTLDNWKLESIGLASFQTQGSPLFNLTLLNQNMVTLPIDGFNDLQSLQKLRISGTRINAVSAHIFQHLNTIQELDLSGNQIDALQDNCFADIEDTLVKLSLSKNILLDDVSKLSGLKSLTNLEELDLSYNNITSVPNLSQLQTTKQLKLYLSNNNITSLAANAFGVLADKLHTLDLSHNKIATINANSFTNVVKLQVLYLSSQTTGGALVLPQSLTQAAGSLKQLDVNGQKMSLPDFWPVVGQLSGLEILNLSTIQLSSMPNLTLGSLINLKTLDISYNNLNTITQEALVGPRKLNFLSLAGNSISTLSSCMFYQYTNYPITMTMGNINPLTCDCTVRWLWNNINSKNITTPSGEEAYCSDNQLLTSKKIDDFCRTPYTDPPCTDYYTTPVLTIFLGQIQTTAFTVSWQLSEPRDLKNFTVKVTNSLSHQPVYETSVSATSKSVTVNNLLTNTLHEVCVTALFNKLPPVSKCDFTSTAKNTTDTTNPQTGPSGEEIGIIVGAVVGAVVLLAILGVIAYLLIARRKSEKKVPNNVPVQPRNFSKSELPAMNEETRTFSKPKQSRGSGGLEHREGMQVVAISDGQTGHPRVGRAHLLNSDGSFKTSVSSKPSSISDQSSHGTYENDHGPLPPTPSKHSSAHLPPGYYNMGYRDDKYDEIVHPKESIL